MRPYKIKPLGFGDLRTPEGRPYRMTPLAFGNLAGAPTAIVNFTQRRCEMQSAFLYSVIFTNGFPNVCARILCHRWQIAQIAVLKLVRIVLSLQFFFHFCKKCLQFFV